MESIVFRYRTYNPHLNHIQLSTSSKPIISKPIISKPEKDIQPKLKQDESQKNPV